jgi:hypothetical protein
MLKENSCPKYREFRTSEVSLYLIALLRKGKNEERNDEMKKEGRKITETL